MNLTLIYASNIERTISNNSNGLLLIHLKMADIDYFFRTLETCMLYESYGRVNKHRMACLGLLMPSPNCNLIGTASQSNFRGYTFNEPLTIAFE